ncbi:MAG: GGDEF domain-containing protein [Candidatus Liptonbacteria bacterium]|nr:GGDEF domain-containing protein [Candidatus Liptonbacteria bacterium]
MKFEFVPPEIHTEESDDFEASREQLAQRLDKEIADEAEKLRLQNELLTLENQYLSRENERLAKLSTKDPLTGIANRRGFEEEVEKILPVPEDEIPERRHSRGKVSFLLLDVDDFKHINERYGHAVGDKVLTAVAEHLRRETRGRDVVGRWGGEEFLIAFNDAEEDMVIHKFTAEGEEEAKISFEVEVEGKKIPVTLSGGLTGFTPGETVEDSLKRADEALRQSKQAGKNRITRFAPEE